MQYFEKMTDLSAVGMHYLTREACHFNLRALFDLTERGADLVRQFHGLHPDAPLADNYNSGDPEDPHVASTMIPVAAFSSLLEFAARASVYNRRSSACLINRDYYGKAEAILVAEDSKDVHLLEEHCAHIHQLNVGEPQADRRAYPTIYTRRK